MIGWQTRVVLDLAALNNAAEKGAFNSQRHAAFAIRKSAIDSMIFARGPSNPGRPPHAHTGKLRRSILVAEDGGSVVVGASHGRNQVGRRPLWLTEMLEHGGTYQVRRKKRSRRGRPSKGDEPQVVSSVTYPPRPFMHPALVRNLDRFHREWQGAIS